MGDRIKTFFQMLAVLAFIVGLFSVLGPGHERQVIIFVLVSIGLAFGYRLPEAAIFVNGFGLFLLLTSAEPYWWVTSAGTVLLLVGTLPIPFLFSWKRREEEFRARREITGIGQKVGALEDKLKRFEHERKALEDEIEKINHLYVLGRELVEHMRLDEVLEHLRKTLLNRPGMRSVMMFTWGKNSWQVLSGSSPGNHPQWLEYMEKQKSLRWEKRYRIIDTPPWLATQSVVFWPVRLESELLAVILLAVDTLHAPRYIEEGQIFVPQIALGLTRTRLFAEVEERSRNDGLTGLYLRRYFIERLQTEVQRVKRYGGSFAVLLADIDHFKKINDTHGHLAGDSVLCQVAKILQESVGPADIVGRYGGEEFVVLLPMCAPEEARSVAAAINAKVASAELAFEGGSCTSSISIGIGHFPADGRTFEELLGAIDEALYWVKANGRNGIKEVADLPRS